MRSLDTLELQYYLTIPHGGWNDRIRVGRRALTQLRLGSNPLRIDTARKDGIPARNRICPMCFDAVETEQHFLLECNTRPAAEARTQLWDQLDRMVNEAAAKGAAAAPAASTLFNVAALSPSAQLTLMTGGGHPAIADRVLTQV